MLPALLRRKDDSTATLGAHDSNTHSPHSTSTFKLNSSSNSSLSAPYPFWQHEISDPTVPDSIAKKVHSKKGNRSSSLSSQKRKMDRKSSGGSGSGSGSSADNDKNGKSVASTVNTTHSSIYRMFHSSENELSSTGSSSSQRGESKREIPGLVSDSIQLPKNLDKETSSSSTNTTTTTTTTISNSSKDGKIATNNGSTTAHRASPVTAVTAVTAAAASPVTVNDLSKLDTTHSGTTTSTGNNPIPLNSRSNSKKRRNSQSLSKPIAQSGHRRIPRTSDYLTDKSTSAVKDFDNSFFHFQDEYIPDLNFKDIVSRWQSDNDAESVDEAKTGGGSSSSGRLSRASNSSAVGIEKPLTFNDLMGGRGSKVAVAAAAKDFAMIPKTQKKWTIGSSPDDDDDESENDDDEEEGGGHFKTTFKNSFSNSHRVLPPISSVLDDEQPEGAIYRGVDVPPRVVAPLPFRKLPKQYSGDNSTDDNDDDINNHNNNNNNSNAGNRSKSPACGTSTSTHSVANVDTFANPLSLLRIRTSPGSLASVTKNTQRRKYLSPMSPAKPIDIEPILSSSSFQPSSSSLLASPITEVPNSPPATAEELKGYMDQLPENFLLLPYSQRKRKILDILPIEKQQYYKSIMSLIKKSALRNSRTNMSLFGSSSRSDGTSYPNLANSFSGQMPAFGGKSNTSINNNNNNSSALSSTMREFQHAAHKTRHGSLASQYLSLFTPNVPTARGDIGIIPGNTANVQQSDASVPSPTAAKSSKDNSFLSMVHFSRPDDKGMQLLGHTLGKIIGFGAWGIIRECTDNATGETHAIKIVRFKTNEKIKKQVLREVDMWKRLSHPHILALKDYQIDENYAVYCLTDKINDGTLYDLVLSWDDLTNTKIPLYKRCRITTTLVYQIIDALKYMHSLNIIHGDVKLENCLIQKPDPGKRNWRTYLCDFGMSCFAPKKQKWNREEQVVIENGNKRTKTVVRSSGDKVSHIGSLPYASPELLSRNAISFSSDVWAFGVMLYTMLLGKLPFKHASEAKLREMIKFGNYDTKSLDFVEEIEDFSGLKDIVIGCLQVESRKRLTIQQVEDTLTSMIKHC